MEKKKRELSGAGELRRKAEERLKEKPSPPEKLSELETQELIQELQVHQIELEMQNEELRKTQAVVEESRAKYSDLYDFAPVGYLSLNRQGLILEANLTLCSKLGIERSLLISINNLFTNFIIKKEEKDLFYKYLGKVFETKSQETCEVELKGKGNTKFYAQLESMVAGDNSSQCRTAMTDITERKQVEERLRKLDQMKTDFVATISHELRTPLSITKEGISLVLDKAAGEINEKQEKMLSTARSNIDRLARIIDNLLDISKIEAGKIDLRRELVDIASLIRQVVSSFALNLKEKNLELKVNIPEKQIDAFVDPDKLTQVFTNLMGNALKFTDRGYIEISLQEKKKQIECFVADTGLGIAEEDLPKAFNRFQQFGRLPGPGEKGTGLGLSITKGIIELHGGKIWVESKLGAGTKFSFILPKYTTEEIFKEYLNNGMKEAMDKKTRMILIVISITEFNKLKQKFSVELMGAILRSMEGIIQDTLRRKGDVVLKDSGEIVVILADCDKEATSSVENRLKKALDKYLTNEKLSGEIKLRFGSAVYPDEAKNDRELIEKAKKG